MVDFVSSGSPSLSEDPALLGGLRRRREFQACTRSKKKFSCVGFSLQALPWSPSRASQIQCLVLSPPAGMTHNFAVQSVERSVKLENWLRVGFTASRKVGNAVRRNRSRRRLKALAELILAHEATPGYDYVFVAHKSTADISFSFLIKDLRRGLTWLKLHKNRSLSKKFEETTKRI